MPIYTFEHSRELTQEQKAALAARVCEIHTTVMRAPAEYVRCAFFRLEPHSGYVAGKPDEDYLALKGEIRPGRPHQMEQKLLWQLNDLIQNELKPAHHYLTLSAFNTPHLIEDGRLLPPAGPPPSTS